MTQNTESVFQKIRVEFLFENPFLSVLALSIKSRYDESKKSLFTTDGKTIYINHLLLKEYKKDEIKYLYAHILLHIIFKHAFRKGTRDKKIWNISTDIAINNILSSLKNSGEKPASELSDEKFMGMVAEEVYEALYKEQEGKEGSSYDEYIGDLECSEMRETKEEDIDSIVVQALTLARKESSLNRTFFNEITELERGNIGIEEILKEYLSSSLFEKNISYTKPNRRYIYKNIYLPGFSKKVERISILVALDSSASISLEEYKLFLSTLLEIGDNFYEKKVKVIPFDNEVLNDLVVDIDEHNIQNSLLSIPKTNGGTNFDKVIEYVDGLDQNEEKQILLVLSDGVFNITKSSRVEVIFALTQKKQVERLEKYGRAVWIKV